MRITKNGEIRAIFVVFFSFFYDDDELNVINNRIGLFVVQHTFTLKRVYIIITSKNEKLQKQNKTKKQYEKRIFRTFSRPGRSSVKKKSYLRNSKEIFFKKKKKSISVIEG